MNKDDTNSEITKKIEENTEKLIKEILVYCREEDKNFFSKQFFDNISKHLKKRGLEVNLSLGKEFIKSMGGVKTATIDGRIIIDNTYEKRIERSLEELKRELSALLIQEG